MSALVLAIGQADPGEKRVAARGADVLVGRAVLPAATFAEGPTAGTLLGPGPINGQSVPFRDKQPVQGFSALLDNGDGSFLALSDNGFGSLDNSADHHLRVYRIRPDFRGRRGGAGRISIEGFFELNDPDRRVPFAITNHFTNPRVLTGADFDPESMRRAPDGTLWFGDEFGPFLLHTDARGKVLEAPIPLPDFDHPGREVRSPQNPLSEEAGAVRVMNAVRAHGRRHGSAHAPVFSPWHVLLEDGNPATFDPTREAPPPGSELAPASSEIFNVGSLKRAGYRVVPWTVNDPRRMRELMRLGVDGLISDRPDLLREAVEEFDTDGDGKGGDLLDAQGLVDRSRFDAQGHRGARDLRPENTLPAMEAGLDHLMSTLELDTVLTRDGQAVLDHGPYVESQKCRRRDGGPYGASHQVLVKDLTLAELQDGFVCDGVFRGPAQRNERDLSPVSVAFASARGLADPYVMPSLAQLFDFVGFYRDHYRSGAGAGQAEATRRGKNAERVRYNIEAKTNPRREPDARGHPLADRTPPPARFAQVLGELITARGLADGCDVQSFDFRNLLELQQSHPAIRTVYLFGDSPLFGAPGRPGWEEGGNLQGEKDGGSSPWLGGLPWPYRVTQRRQAFRAQPSGGFEGMALTTDGRRLLPLLEKPLVGDPPGTLLIHSFDLALRRYTGERHLYVREARGTAIGDFLMYGPSHGLVLERDDSQGDPGGFKAVYQVRLNAPGQPVSKALVLDLLRIHDADGLSEPGRPGDVGIGRRFAFPFVTVEGLVLLDRRRVGVVNDNNFPFSVGRHRGTGEPDDTELVVIRLARPLRP